jgi:transposase
MRRPLSTAKTTMHQAGASPRSRASTPRQRLDNNPIGYVASARRIAQFMTSARNHLSKADAVLVTQIETALPALAVARVLVDRFTDMVPNVTADGLTRWLDGAATSNMASFAHGLRSDLPAVAAALTEYWSNGQTEGQVKQLKTLKRQIYGCVTVDLVKARLVATT